MSVGVNHPSTLWKLSTFATATCSIKCACGIMIIIIMSLFHEEHTLSICTNLP